MRAVTGLEPATDNHSLGFRLAGWAGQNRPDPLGAPPGAPEIRQKIKKLKYGNG